MEETVKTMATILERNEISALEMEALITMKAGLYLMKIGGMEGPSYNGTSVQYNIKKGLIDKLCEKGYIYEQRPGIFLLTDNGLLIVKYYLDT